MVEIATLDDVDGEPHAVVLGGSPLRTVRLRLAAGESVPPHDHPGSEVLLYLLSGELELALDGEPHRLTAGDVARFDGDQDVSPRAVEAATALIVFAPAE